MRGHFDAEDIDGRPIRIVYINEDEKRTEKIIKAEVEVLREFAAAYTRGEPVSLKASLVKCTRLSKKYSGRRGDAASSQLSALPNHRGPVSSAKSVYTMMTTSEGAPSNC